MKDVRQETEAGRGKRTLLHVCCGPCASACVPRLKGLDREVTLLFANSNIDTKEEFEKRLREAEKLAAVDGVKIATLPYDHGEWLREVAAGCEREPEKGARCARCFRYNLTKAAEYAQSHGYDEFTTSLTVSPHKVSKVIFDVARSLPSVRSDSGVRAPAFLFEDFKKREGFKLSVRRAAELGLYRQAYCGCEFSRLPRWRIHRKHETASTNLDARAGAHGDVFTADFQTAGRGRLDHRWLSPSGENLMMSAVLSVEGLAPEQVATFPLVVGLAVARAVRFLTSGPRSPNPALKWPNDVLVDGRKIAGILCERQGDVVIAGVGVNVAQTDFAPELAGRATSLALLPAAGPAAVADVRDAVLWELGRAYDLWRTRGFAAVYPEIASVDYLRGRAVSVFQTDDDATPVTGVSGGILSDGSLDVSGEKIFAGEIHVVLK